MDFVLNLDIWRTARKTILKKYELDFVNDLWLLWLKLNEERTKYDEYKLAMFTFDYKSVINNSVQTIKIDISIKNRLYLPIFSGEIKSNFRDALLEENIFQTHFINCINLKESVAEKLRASLTRKESAIRDFFDIWYIKNNSDLNFNDEEFRNLLDIKLGEAEYNYSLEENYESLKKQVQTDLKPVLNNDYKFDFEEVFNYILSFTK